MLVLRGCTHTDTEQSTQTQPWPHSSSLTPFLHPSCTNSTFIHSKNSNRYILHTHTSTRTAKNLIGYRPTSEGYTGQRSRLLLSHSYRQASFGTLWASRMDWKQLLWSEARAHHWLFATIWGQFIMFLKYLIYMLGPSPSSCPNLSPSARRQWGFLN